MNSMFTFFYALIWFIPYMHWFLQSFYIRHLNLLILYMKYMHRFYRLISCISLCINLVHQVLCYIIILFGCKSCTSLHLLLLQICRGFQVLSNEIVKHANFNLENMRFSYLIISWFGSFFQVWRRYSWIWAYWTDWNEAKA